MSKQMPGQDLAGRRLGRYTLVEPLAAGAMGRVFRAELVGPSGFRKAVAVKLLRPRAAPGPRAREMFIQEARLSALVRHPNVVDVYDFGECDGELYVAMELVSGPSLAALLDAGPLPPGALLELGQQVAGGLAALHDLDLAEGRSGGLVHQDIKPANLLIDRYGVVKIADFGIARLRGGEERSKVWGTPPYMSPEQADGEAVDGRSDIFALGSVLYRAATGQRLFPGPGRKNTLNQVRDVELLLRPGGVIEAVDEVVPGLAGVLRRCLRRRPHARWEDAHALWAALATLRGKVPPTPTLRELVREYRPHRAGDDTAASGAYSVLTHSQSNLVLPSSSFVGRAEEVEDLRAALLDAEHRLVALVGPAGVGKTRLAQEVGAALVREEGWNAWLLKPASPGPEAMVRAAVNALGLPIAAGVHPLDALAMALSTHGPTLLILDDLSGGAELEEIIEALMAEARGLRVLITARDVPAIEGAVTWPVEPLDEAAALALLQERSGVGDRASLGAVMVSLDRRPLVLELAAAGLRGGQPAALQARMAEGGDLLGDGLGWVWEQLTLAERTCLVQCAVFRGPFDLDDAEAVVELGPVAPGACVGELLIPLVERGLLHARRGVLALPDAVWEDARQRAMEELSDAGRRALGTRHAEWFARLGSEAWQLRLRGPGGARAVRRLLRAEADLLAAMRWSMVIGRLDLAARHGRALYTLADSHAVSPELDELGKLLLSAADLTPADRVMLSLAAVGPLSLRGEASRAAALAREALALAEDERTRGMAAAALGNLARLAGDYEAAAAHLEQAHSLARAARARPLEALVLCRAGVLQSRLGRGDKGLAHLERGLLLARSLGDKRLEFMALGSMGLARMRLGELEPARFLLKQALSSAAIYGDRVYEAVTHSNLALLESRAGNLRAARRHTETAGALLRAQGWRRSVAHNRGALGEILLALGELEAATAELEAAAGASSTSGNNEALVGWLSDLGLVWEARGDLARARAYLDQALSRASSPADRALVWSNRTSLELTAGDVEAASAAADRARRAVRGMPEGRLPGAVALLCGEVALARGELAAARAELERGLAQLGGDSGVRLRGILVLARLLAAEGDPGGAARALAEVRDWVEAAGLGPAAPLRRRLAAAEAAIGG